MVSVRCQNKNVPFVHFSTILLIVTLPASLQSRVATLISFKAPLLPYSQIYPSSPSHMSHPCSSMSITAMLSQALIPHNVDHCHKSWTHFPYVQLDFILCTTIRIIFKYHYLHIIHGLKTKYLLNAFYSKQSSQLCRQLTNFIYFLHIPANTMPALFSEFICLLIYCNIEFEHDLLPTSF